MTPSIATGYTGHAPYIPAEQGKESYNFVEKTINLAAGFLLKNPSYLIFAAVGAGFGGLGGFAIGVASCAVVHSLIPDQSENTQPLSRHEMSGRCGLKNCRHC